MADQNGTNGTNSTNSSTSAAKLLSAWVRQIVANGTFTNSSTNSSVTNSTSVLPEEEGVDLVVIMLALAGVLFVVLVPVCVCAEVLGVGAFKRGARLSDLDVSPIGKVFGDVLGFVCFFPGTLPVVLMPWCFFLGCLLSLIEGWDLQAGAVHVVVAVFNPGARAALSPLTAGGQVVVLMSTLLTMLLTLCLVGWAAQTTAFKRIVWFSKRNTYGLLRALAMYVPLAMLAVALPAGAILASLEGWPLEDGWFLIAEALAGSAAPGRAIAPRSAAGCCVVAVCMAGELTLATCIVCFCLYHPAADRWVDILQGPLTEKAGRCQRCCGWCCLRCRRWRTYRRRGVDTESVAVQKTDNSQFDMTVHELIGHHSGRRTHRPSHIGSQVQPAEEANTRTPQQDLHEDRVKEREHILALIAESTQILADQKTLLDKERAELEAEILHLREHGYEEAMKASAPLMAAAKRERQLAASALEFAMQMADVENRRSAEDKDNAAKALSAVVSAALGQAQQAAPPAEEVPSCPSPVPDKP